MKSRVRIHKGQGVAQKKTGLPNTEINGLKEKSSVISVYLFSPCQ